MKLFRYRRPSLNTLLGITKAKKRVKKELGITDALKPFRWWTNAKRRFKRKVGGRVAVTEWIAERVFGGGFCGGWNGDDGGWGVGEVIGNSMISKPKHGERKHDCQDTIHDGSDCRRDRHWFWCNGPS